MDGSNIGVGGCDDVDDDEDEAVEFDLGRVTSLGRVRSLGRVDALERSTVPLAW